MWQMAGGDEVHHAEPSRIVECYGNARRHREHDMVVTILQRPIAIAAVPGCGRCALDPEPSRHPKMHDERIAARESDQQIFATAGNGSYRLAAQSPYEAFREGPAQIFPIEANPRKTRAGHGRVESLPNAFDFWKFRHCRPIVSLSSKTASAATQQTIPDS
jgi:hypothetical protein